MGYAIGQRDRKLVLISTSAMVRHKTLLGSRPPTLQPCIALPLPPKTSNQQPPDPGTLHSTPSPTKDQQPSDPGTNRENDFPPVGLTYSAITLAVVFLLTTLLIAVALAVLIRTKGKR